MSIVEVCMGGGETVRDAKHLGKLSLTGGALVDVSRAVGAFEPESERCQLLGGEARHLRVGLCLGIGA